MAYGIEGTRLRLVMLDAERHLENALTWLNDPEITQWLLLDHPMSRLSEQDFFEKAARKSESDMILAIETLEGKHIGMSGIHSINFRHGHCKTGSFIGDKSEWGKGYGKENVMLRADYIFNVLGLRMIETSTFEGNERSMRMSKSAGFQEVGFLPDRYWKCGKFVGEHLLILRREWFGQN